MNEIRICWDVNSKPSATECAQNAGHWHPDSPNNREMLKIILESAIEIHGVGTHWIETRYSAEPYSSAALNFQGSYKN